MPDPGERVAETSGHQHRWTRRSWKAQRRFCVCGEWEPEPETPLRPPPEPWMTPEEMLREFHETAGLRLPDHPTFDIGAEFVSDEVRQKMLDSEVQELRDAVAAGNLTEIADALADIVYVAVGTAVTYGIPFDAVFTEVHRSNMTKFLPGGPVINEDGKIVKGTGYKPPRIAELLGKETDHA